MLPNWDFDGDAENRRVFTAWVWAELDRFAQLTGTDRSPNDHNVDWSEWLDGSRQPVGRPANPAGGMNDLIWEYAMLRFMFNRYWPGRKRRKDDPAHAANLAIARCRAPLAKHQRTADGTQVRAGLRDQLLEEWERRSKNRGWEEAQRDIAILESLPPAILAK